MERIKRVFPIVFIALFWILYIVGIFHSFNKHPRDAFFVKICPFAVYRGVEIFWHNDFKGVDWNKRMKADVWTMYKLMDISRETEMVEDLSIQIEKFSEKIKNYPSSKKNYLKEAAKKYIRYNLIATDDLLEYISNLLSSGNRPNPIEWNIKSKSLKDSIINMYGIVELEGDKKQMDSVLAILTLQSGFGELDREKTNSAVNFLSTGRRKILEMYTRVYKMIFDENIIIENISI